jgi:hypothetical protein
MIRILLGSSLVAGVVSELDVFGIARRESLLEVLSTLDSSARTDVQLKASMSRRRFWGNNKDACEASGSSDATNDDCYSRRWKLLQDYYTKYYTNISSTDRKMLVTEFGIEGTMGQATNQIDRSVSLVVGNDGTFVSPSVRDGLVFQTKLLLNGTAQLQRASIASVDALFNSVIGLAAQSLNGTSTLKSNVAGAYGNLMKQVQAALAAQNARAENNTKVAGKVGEAAVNSTIKTVNASQVAVQNTVATGLAVTGNASVAFSTSAAKLSSALSDSDDLVGQNAQKIDQDSDKKVTTLSTQLGAGVDSVLDEADKQSSNLASQSNGITQALKSETDAQIQSANEELGDAVTQATARGQSTVASVSTKIDNSTEAFQNNISGVSSTTSSTIKSTQNGIQTSANDATKVAKDVASSASTLADSTNTNLNGASTDANQMSSSAANSVEQEKQKIAQILLAQQSTSGQSMQSIIAALSGAQGDAQAMLGDTQASSQEQVAAYLAKLGNNGVAVSNLLGSLQQAVSSGQTSTSGEIAGAFGAARRQAGDTQVELEASLDGVAGSLTESQKAFADSTKSLSNSVKSEIQSGAASTANGINSLTATSLKSKHDLLASLMNYQADADGQADEFSKALDGLTSGLGSESAGTGVGKSALFSTSDGIDNSLAALAAGLGNSDSNLADILSGKLWETNKLMNNVGSDLTSKASSEISQLWSRTSGDLTRREQTNDKAVADAESAENGAMARANALGQTAQGLLQTTQTLVGDGESKSQLALENFRAQLAQMSAKDNSTVNALQAVLNGYTGDAMNDVGGYLSSLISSKNANISQSVDTRLAEIQKMNSRTVSVSANEQQLAAIVAALSRSSSSSQSDLINGILKVLDSTKSVADSFGGRIETLLKNFNDVKTRTSSGLRNLTDAVQSEVLKIPQILTRGAASLQNNFDLAANDLQNNINVLHEKLASAQNEEEKEAAMQGLVVLEKLQALQQGVAEADHKLRSQIQDGATDQLDKAGNVQGAMANVLSAMSTLNSQMDVSRIAVQQNTETIGKQTASLVNGMNIMVNQTAAELADRAAQAAVASRFNLNMAQARTQVRAAAAVGGVNQTLNQYTAQHASAFNHSGETHSDIEMLSKTTAASSAALGEKIDAVLRQVLSASANIQANSANSDGDVVTRLAVVRMAMSKFLGLWNEYVLNMDRKLQRFHSVDSQFVGLMENEIKRELVGTEAGVNATSAEIVKLKAQLDAATTAQDDFESFFSSNIDDLKTVLKDMNNQQSAANLASISNVNQLFDFSTQSNAGLKEDANNLIGQFEDAVASRIHQANSGVGVSLLEKEIRALDADVSGVI